LTICTLELQAQLQPRKGYPLVPKSIVDYLKQYRLDKRLTRFELANKLNVYESTIDKWERGVTKPNKENKQRIIRLLGYNPMQNIITI